MSHLSPRYKHTSRRGSSASNTFKSIEEIKHSLSELDSYLSITEDMIEKEKELDRELYRREREKKYRKSESDEIPQSSNSTPSPKLLHKLSRLRFEDGKVICIDEESPKANIAVTHKIVKEIIANETKLVNLETLFDITNSPPTTPPKLSEEAEIVLFTQEEGNNEGKCRSFDENLLRNSSDEENKSDFNSLPIVPAEIDEELVKKFIAAKNGVNLKKSSPMWVGLYGFFANFSIFTLKQ